MRKGLKKKEAPAKMEPIVPIINSQAIRQAISEKAFELYEKGGRCHGHDQEDWLEAEQLILSEKRASLSVQKSLSSIPRSEVNG